MLIGVLTHQKSLVSEESYRKFFDRTEANLDFDTSFIVIFGQKLASETKIISLIPPKKVFFFLIPVYGLKKVSKNCTCLKLISKN